MRFLAFMVIFFFVVGFVFFLTTIAVGSADNNGKIDGIEVYFLAVAVVSMGLSLGSLKLLESLAKLDAFDKKMDDLHELNQREYRK